MSRHIIYFLLILFLCPLRSNAVELRQLKSPEIIVLFETPLQNAAEKISNAYPEIRHTVIKKLGWKVEFIPTVILIRENKVFQTAVRNDLITAYAVPKKNLIVMDYAKMGRTPVDLQETFEHELYHLVIHSHIESSNLPRWLDEGIAQWASGGIADIINPGNRDILKQAVLTDKLIPFESLAETFPPRSRNLILAYQQSRSIVEYIVHEYGEERLIGVLESLKQGQPIEDAVSENLSINFTRLKDDWHRHLVRKYSWMTYMADHIYWILFFVAAVITLLGYIRFRIRLRNYRDEDEDWAGEQ